MLQSTVSQYVTGINLSVENVDNFSESQHIKQKKDKTFNQ